MTVQNPSLSSRISVLGFNTLSYLLGSSSLILLILVYGNIVTPENSPIFRGPQFDSNAMTILWNAIWIIGFGYKHTKMASTQFKEKMARFIPDAMNRGIYVLATAIYLCTMLHFWSPMDITLWTTSGAVYWVVMGIFLFGWSFLFIATFMIDHFELFGLKQAYFHFKQHQLPELTFVKNGFYAYIRHPIMTGLLIGIWFIPTMSMSLLIMSIGFTCYVFIGVYFEERKLKRLLGSQYEIYCREVGSLIPKFG